MNKMKTIVFYDKKDVNEFVEKQNKQNTGGIISINTKYDDDKKCDVTTITYIENESKGIIL